MANQRCGNILRTSSVGFSFLFFFEFFKNIYSYRTLLAFLNQNFIPDIDKVRSTVISPDIPVSGYHAHTQSVLRQFGSWVSPRV